MRTNVRRILNQKICFLDHFWERYLIFRKSAHFAPKCANVGSLWDKLTHTNLFKKCWGFPVIVFGPCRVYSLHIMWKKDQKLLQMWGHTLCHVYSTIVRKCSNFVQNLSAHHVEPCGIWVLRYGGSTDIKFMYFGSVEPKIQLGVSPRLKHGPMRRWTRELSPQESWRQSSRSNW